MADRFPRDLSQQKACGLLRYHSIIRKSQVFPFLQTQEESIHTKVMAEDTVGNGIVRVGVFYVKEQRLKTLSVKQSNLTETGYPLTPTSVQKTMTELELGGGGC